MAFWNRKKKKEKKEETKSKSNSDQNIKKYGYKNYMDDKDIKDIIEYYQNTYSEEAMTKAMLVFILTLDGIYKKVDKKYSDEKENKIVRGIIQDGFAFLNTEVRNTNMKMGKNMYDDEQIKLLIKVAFDGAVISAFDTRTEEEKLEDYKKAAERLFNSSKK